MAPWWEDKDSGGKKTGKNKLIKRACLESALAKDERNEEREKERKKEKERTKKKRRCGGRDKKEDKISAAPCPT